MVFLLCNNWDYTHLMTSSCLPKCFIAHSACVGDQYKSEILYCSVQFIMYDAQEVKRNDHRCAVCSFESVHVPITNVPKK
jgi:hypothetical protein